MSDEPAQVRRARPPSTEGEALTPDGGRAATEVTDPAMATTSGGPGDGSSESEATGSPVTELPLAGPPSTEAAIVDPADADAEVDGADGSTAGRGVRAALPPWRGVVGWLAFSAIVTALDGWVGAGAAVLVGAVVLAGVSSRILAAVGVLLLAAIPVVVLLEGLPSAEEVSPSFVSRSLWPHHLTFAGLVLLSAWAVLDLAHHHRLGLPAHADHVDGIDEPAAIDAPGAGLGLRVRVALVALTAVAALVAIVAVIAR